MRTLALIAVVFSASPAWAQDGFGANAIVEPPPAALQEEDPSAAGTTIEMRDPAAGADLAELLQEAPGTRIALTGGAGQLASVGLRGADIGHTEFVLGELPLAGPDTGPLDLSLWPPEMLERVEVYRGGAPTWLGSGAIGGVVRLVPREDRIDSLGAGLTLGSFRTWRVRAHAATGDALRVVGVAGVDGSDNDYPFQSDGGTSLDPSDDHTAHRQNADTLGGHALLHLRADVGASELRAVVASLSRQGGVPGPANRTTRDASLRQHRLLGTVSLQHRFPNARLQVSAGGGVHRRQLVDLRGELYAPQDSDDWIDDAQLRVASSIRLARMLDWIVVGGARREGYRPSNPLGRVLSDSQRWRLYGASELRAHGKLGSTRVELRPSVRVEHVRTDAYGLRHNNEERYRRSAEQVTGRVGALVSPTSAVSLTASFSSGSRFPASWQLFGDRVVIVGNPELKPERGQTLDGGIVLRGRRGLVRASFEARAFHQRLDDLIRPRRISRDQIRFENADRARVIGGEIGSQGELGKHLAWSGSLTAMHTDIDDAELTWRPRLQTWVQPEVRTGRLGALTQLAIFAAVTHRGAYFNDPANLVRLPARTWVALGARVELDGGLSIRITGRDLFDERGSDLLGFPLPGRRVAVAIDYRTEL